MSIVETKLKLKPRRDVAARLDLVTLQDGSVGQAIEIYATPHSRFAKLESWTMTKSSILMRLK